MKEPSTKSVDAEATPVVAGGSDKVPKSPRDKKRTIEIALVIGGIVAVLVAIFAVWWFFLRPGTNYADLSQLNSQDRYIKQAQEWSKQPIPNTARDKAIYYGNIATALAAGKEYKYAEHYYLLAQQIVDDNKVDKKDVEFYQGLSDLYKAMGNKQKADEYAKKEQDFLKANYSPEILKQMQEVKLNDPKR